MKKRIVALVLATIFVATCLPLGGFAAIDTSVFTEPTVVVESTAAIAGNTVEVDLLMVNNPGIAGAKITISYDEKLTLLNAASGSAFAALDYTRPGVYANPCNFTWDSESAEVSADGVLLTLTFQVSEDAEKNEKLDVNVSYKYGHIYDSDLESIAFNMVSGFVNVIDYIPGDVNSDGEVSGKDVTLVRRFNAGGYDVSIKEAAADVNDDGDISGKDVTLIRRYNAGGYDVELLPSTPKCSHNMQKTAEKSPTCEEDGNCAYWYCTKCQKYFTNETGATEIELKDTVLEKTGHTEKVIPGYPADYGKEGLTDGVKCSVCGKTIVEQKSIDALVPNEYAITYKIAGSDAYLQGLEKAGKIENTNPDRYAQHLGLAKLNNLSVDGYEFKGWYDSDGKRYTSIPAGTEGEIELIAKWNKVVYTITYDSPDFDIIIEKDGVKYTNEQKYTVDTAVALPTPEISKYIFVGWSNEDGFIMPRVLPAGTAANMTLHANWTSERNKATSYSNYGAPIIIADEEEMQITFVYDIGKIENVPLRAYEGENSYFQITSSDNPIEINQQFEMTETYGSDEMESVAETVANATTRSSAWTLSKEWNELYSEGTEDQRGQIKSDERTDTQGNVVGGKYFVSNSQGGSSYVSTESGSSASNSAKVTTENSFGTNYSYDQSTELYAEGKLSAKNETEVSAKASVSYGVAKAEAGVKNTTTIGAEMTSGRKDKESVHFDGQTSSYIGTDNSSSSSSYYNVATNESTSWNSDTGYEKSNSIHNESKVLTAISDEVKKTNKYNFSKSLSGTNTEHEIVEGQETNEKAYSTSVRYNHGTGETRTYSVKGTYSMPGYYRWVEAGTVHVYGVVGYDIATGSYYTRTYSVLADETKPYQDFSRTTSAFNDCENGVVTFDIPYEVNEYVLALTAATDGIEVDYQGKVNAFDPKPIKPAGEEAKEDDIQKYWDKTVILPQYYSIDNGDDTASAVKVNSIDPDIFASETVKQNLTTVVLPSYVTEIPAGTFKDCVNLKTVVGFGITSIGAEAFAGCTGLETFYVDNLIESVGKDAFRDVPAIKVMASSPEVAEAAIQSGAKSISLDLTKMNGDFDQRKITIPEGSAYFALIGGGKTFTNLQIESHAEETFLSNMTLTGNLSTPLTVTSAKLTLARVTINNTPGYAMKLLAENTSVYLQGTISVETKGEYAVIGRSVSFAKANSGVTGVLSLTGSYAIYGERKGDAMVTFTDTAKYGWVEIEDSEAYNTMLDTVTVTFDANSGTFADETEKAVKSYQYESAYGEMPVPTRTGYTFKGWFTEQTGGTCVTKDDKANATVTLYAQWEAMAYTVSWNTGTGYSIGVKRASSPYAGAATGNLNSGDPIYYGDVLSVIYTASTGYALTSNGKTSVTVAGDVTASDIYATATVNAYKVSWKDCWGCNITVKRTSSPYAGAANKTLINDEAIYYGDVLKITYSAQTGFTLGNVGKTDITVTGNVTASDIYATAYLNEYPVSWSTPANGSITVKRTSSPYAGAASGAISNGAKVYYGDTITVTYGAATGYNVKDHGGTSYTVTRNITGSDIYLTVSPNSYPYGIVYQSSNGTALGSSSATYNYGTTNTISAPAIAGYVTPPSQTVKWDATSKTITFVYTPADVSNPEFRGDFRWNPYIEYYTTMTYRNRTATSVEVMISTAVVMQANWQGYGLGVAFDATCGSAGTGKVVISGTNGLSWGGAVARGTSGWVTVPLNTTNATTLNFGANIYNVNWENNYVNHSEYSYSSYTWSMNIPAY